LQPSAEHRKRYLRTSSRTNVGADKDSDKRQRAAIEAYAKAAGYEIVDTFYDAAVSGADPVGERSGFAEMLERLMSNGARTIIVESPDRFARDLMVQLAGHDMLKARGATLIAASAPTFFVEDTPTAALVRQVLGAVAEFEKATLVAKLAAARKRERMATGKKVESAETGLPVLAGRDDVPVDGCVKAGESQTRVKLVRER
jgi:DNA invertase Pin-like site-specific DNA recombinase